MRARGIKPGFFKNEYLAELGSMTRLLFAGLWCMADREGRLEDRPKRIKAEIFPYDECNVDELLDGLEGAGFIIRYKANGQSLMQVCNFLKHQMPHYKESASVLPPPDGWKDSQYPGGSIPASIRAAVLERDSHTCQECGSTTNLTLDHIVPQSRGGAHTEDNLRTLCRRCNSAKNNREATSNVGATSAQRRAKRGASKSLVDPLTPDSGLLTPDSLTPSSLTPDPPIAPQGAELGLLGEERYEHWKQVFPRETAQLTYTIDTRRAVEARLREGIPPGVIDQAVTNAKHAPWWNGAQDGIWKAHLKKICGKGSTVETLAANGNGCSHDDDCPAITEESSRALMEMNP